MTWSPWKWKKPLFWVQLFPGDPKKILCIQRLNSGVFSSSGPFNQDNECLRDEKCSHEMFRQEEMSRASLEKHTLWPGPIRAQYILRLASDTSKRRSYRAPFYKVLNLSLFLKTDDFTGAYQGVRKPTSLQKQSHVHRKNKGCQNASMGLQRALYEAWFGRILANGGWICVILKIVVKFCLLWFFKDISSCIFPDWVSFLSIG
jgi:hypothetical protein